MVEPTEEQINQIREAALKAEEFESEYWSMSYEEGVRTCLDWIFERGEFPLD